MPVNYDSATLDAARCLWDYHNMQMQLPDHADLVLAAGSHDLRVAFRAAEHMLDGRADWLAVSGGWGKVTRDLWHETEAAKFAEIAIGRGVEADRVIVEDKATNSLENIQFVKALIRERGLRVHTAIVVGKPYMKRRLYATALRQWPEAEWFADAPDVTFEAYATDEVPLERTIELMVGDLQRLELYADQGSQVRQTIPESVWEAYRRLVAEGYDRFVIPPTTSEDA